MCQEPPTVFLVDDDAGCAKVTLRLLASAGYLARWFESGAAFLEALTGQERGCVLLDLVMPGLDGIQLQEQLNARGITLPVVFFSGYGTVRHCAQAMKSGACDFLEKPTSREVLLAAVERALAAGNALGYHQRQRQELTTRYARLSAREKEVLDLIARGLTSRAAGEVLHIAEKTVKVHRSRLRAKLQVDSVAELVLVARTLGRV